MVESNNNGKIKSAEFRGMMLERTGTILKDIETLQKTVDNHTKSIERLKVKAGVWGLLGGTIPVAITIAVAVSIWLIKG